MECKVTHGEGQQGIPPAQRPWVMQDVITVDKTPAIVMLALYQHQLAEMLDIMTSKSGNLPLGLLLESEEFLDEWETDVITNYSSQISQRRNCLEEVQEETARQACFSMFEKLRTAISQCRAVIDGEVNKTQQEKATTEVFLPLSKPIGAVATKDSVGVKATEVQGENRSEDNNHSLMMTNLQGVNQSEDDKDSFMSPMVIGDEKIQYDCKQWQLQEQTAIDTRCPSARPVHQLGENCKHNAFLQHDQASVAKQDEVMCHLLPSAGMTRTACTKNGPEVVLLHRHQVRAEKSGGRGSGG
ncbi:hypothetical protein CBR_g19824 [Chara braunii]|uniref:Uncharacterized protein n=1 Tax=Chara braunii TaxID=69332 RepID=A0A388JU17_CHABU|nr:hypothetical protein CBR_g19824 [Chara braunii]|eukprot:GBG61291.1 hypothetical protein CBR_g19824 [Chara braunii]